MDSEKPTLKVIRSQTAIDELDGIWRWNAELYNIPHADEYLAFLKQTLDELRNNYAHGRAIRTRPDLHYIIVRRRTSGHGHVVVYNFNNTEVHIPHVFHTAQDWQTKVIDVRATLE